MSTYNGWTNYETWRVNLEFFDGFDLEEYFQLNIEACDLDAIPADLKNYVETFLEEQSNQENSTIMAYAMAFLADVNWHEIASHLIDEAKERAE